jgi:sec-independent protein translocase protein TatA
MESFLMGGFSISHLVLVAIIGLLLFGGRNKISDIMGDVAKGIKSFKKGLAEPEAATPFSAGASAQSLGFEPGSQASRTEAAQVVNPTDK